jgi:hypothetical protein
MAKKTRGMMEAYCNWESRRPFTHNTSYFEVLRPVIYLHLAQQRYGTKSAANTFQLLDSPASTNVDENVVETDFPIGVRLQALNNKDTYKAELGIAADIAAYCRVAVKRAVEIVPMCIENEFLVAFGEELRRTLEKRLGLIGDSAAETCAKYAVEDRDIQERRARLIEMRDTLIMRLKY